MDLAADMAPAAANMKEASAENVLGSATDDALAQMYCNFSTMSRGMLDAIIAATRLGPATAASGAELLARIDALPGSQCFALVVYLHWVPHAQRNSCCFSSRVTWITGVEFSSFDITVDQHDYTLWMRDLLETVHVLLDRVGLDLELPKLVGPTAEINSLWRAAAYQRHLRSFLEAGGDLQRDLLLPLIFYSGVRLACCYV